MDLPWGRSSEDQTDIAIARSVLDEDHYSLQGVKDRIIEYLAVRNLLAIRDANEKTDSQSKVSAATGVILCFAGPPGVGKTSLGQSIARAMGREFTRMSPWLVSEMKLKSGVTDGLTLAPCRENHPGNQTRRHPQPGLYARRGRQNRHGLAVGGDILFIEATRMEGNGKLR